MDVLYLLLCRMSVRRLCSDCRTSRGPCVIRGSQAAASSGRASAAGRGGGSGTSASGVASDGGGACVCPKAVRDGACRVDPHCRRRPSSPPRRICPSPMPVFQFLHYVLISLLCLRFHFPFDHFDLNQPGMPSHQLVVQLTPCSKT